MRKYERLIEELDNLAQGHEKDRATYTAAKIREAIAAIEELLPAQDSELDDLK